MRNRMYRLLKSRKGGIPTIITIIATTVVAMGLFSYTIMSQSASVKESGDKVLREQNKINLLLDNSDYVTGKVAVDYFERLGAGNVTIYQSDGATEIDAPLVDAQAIFSFAPGYGEGGKIETAEFTRVDLGA